MSDSGASAGWYPDPAGSGWQRYFDGTRWTDHTAPPPAWTLPSQYRYGAWGAQTWKGAQLGLPPSGPGALANQGRRLAARALDTLVLLPVLAAFLAIALSLVIPRAGPLFPKVSTNPNATVPFAGIFWVELAVFGCLFTFGLVFVVYETVATARCGRTLGKAWLHIRPVRLHGGNLGWGRSFGRAALAWLGLMINMPGWLDSLWCLWDSNQQCLHDKAVDSIVINDQDRPASSDTP